MTYLRAITSKLQASISIGKSVLLFGPRQTGKTTLVTSLTHDLYINLMRARSLKTYEQDAEVLYQEISALYEAKASRPIVIIDEIQKIPSLTDTIQLLIDEKKAQFIITVSSARKIKNLLPGRVIKYTLSPLMVEELQSTEIDLHYILENGTLPEIYSIRYQDAVEEILETYVNLYLEEEVRKESLVRNMGTFSNFLQLACIESGNNLNLSAIGSELGVSHNTIAEYYRILQDCMLVETVAPFTKSNTRKRLVKLNKYIIFDLGVRRLGAKEAYNNSIRNLGFKFEQFIGLELSRLVRIYDSKYKVMYWRSHDGPEIDYVLSSQDTLVPIEVKLTENPTLKDARHLMTFCTEYSVKQAYIVCRCNMPRRINELVTALPWQQLVEVFPSRSDIDA